MKHTRMITRCGAAAAVLTLTLSLAACGDDDHDVSRLDSRVVNGTVTSLAGDSYYDRQWLMTQIRADEADDVADCMADQGRQDTREHIEYYLSRFDAMQDANFPPAERFRKEGVTPPGSLDGLDDDQSLHEDAAIGCRTRYEEDETSSAGGIRFEVSGEWGSEVDEFYASHDFSGEFATFEKCLQDKTGYPGDQVTPAESRGSTGSWTGGPSNSAGTSR